MLEDEQPIYIYFDFSVATNWAPFIHVVFIIHTNNSSFTSLIFVWLLNKMSIHQYYNIIIGTLHIEGESVF